MVKRNLEARAKQLENDIKNLVDQCKNSPPGERVKVSELISLKTAEYESITGKCYRIGNNYQFEKQD